MATFWVGRGGNSPNATERGVFVPEAEDPLNLRVKRRGDYSETHDGFYVLDGAFDNGHNWPKRPRLEDWDGVMKQHHRHSLPQYQQPRAWPRNDDSGIPPVSSEIAPVRNTAFHVIRGSSPVSEPQMPMHLTRSLSPASMERTESGLSISSDTSSYEDENSLAAGKLLSDLAAARLVRNHIALGRADSQSKRILTSLINPKHDYKLDNDALCSLFSAANDLFFVNRLTQRVAWDWSHQASEQYAQHVVGTTALRRSVKLGGYETLIVLSSPILKSTQYNRRLLISTFLHEMIHSFLFVTCGIKAKLRGGHTTGFKEIAEAIDNFVGRDFLRLGDMEADLERFRCQNDVAGRPCSSGHMEWQPGARDDYFATEPRPSRSAAGYPEWQWSVEEDFGAPSRTRTPPVDLPPHSAVVGVFAAAGITNSPPRKRYYYRPQNQRQHQPYYHQQHHHHTFY